MFLITSLKAKVKEKPKAEELAAKAMDKKTEKVTTCNLCVCLCVRLAFPKFQ